MSLLSLRRWFAPVAALSLVMSTLAGCGKSAATSSSASFAAPSATASAQDAGARSDAMGKFSLLTFFALDNDLDNGSYSLVEELDDAAARSRNVTFVTQFDGAKNGDSVRHVGGGGVMAANNKLGEIDTGKAAAVADLMAFAGPRTQGTRRVISMADHGGGIVRGVLADWNAPGGKTIIHIKDMAPIFKQTPVEIMMFDACFMSMAEVAYELREGTRYLVAAQTTTRGDYPYAEIAQILERGVNADSATIAKQITTAVANNAYYNDVTFGALDTQVVATELVPRVRAMSEAMIAALPARKAEITEAFKEAVAYAHFTEPGFDLYNHFRDLGDIARNLATTSDPALAKAAAEVARLAEDKRLNLIQFTKGARMKGATGVAVYAPAGTTVASNYLTNNAFAKDTKWGEALVKLNGGGAWAPTAPDKYPQAFPSRR